MGVQGSLANSIVNHYNTALSQIPGTVYDKYVTDEIDLGSDRDGYYHLLALHIPVSGVYVVAAGVRQQLRGGCDSCVNHGITIYTNVSNSPTDTADFYRGSAGSSSGLPGQIFHLSANPIYTISGGQYINMTIYGPPMRIFRRYITALLVRKF